MPLLGASSSRDNVTNLKASFQIQLPRLYGINSYSRVTSKPLIEDEEANRMATTNFHLFIPFFFDNIEHSRMF